MEGNGYYDVFRIDVYDVLNKKNSYNIVLVHCALDYALDRKKWPIRGE